jgi:hypothetical protein
MTARFTLCSASHSGSVKDSSHQAITTTSAMKANACMGASLP